MKTVNFRAEREYLRNALINLQADLPRMTPDQLTQAEVLVRETEQLVSKMDEIEAAFDAVRIASPKESP